MDHLITCDNITSKEDTYPFKKKKKKKKTTNKERIGHDSRFLEIEVKSFILCVKLFYIKVKIY